MAHFARLDANNIVTDVIVIGDSDSGGGTLATESVGISFCKNHVGDSSSVWKQTSYNRNFRGKFAGIGLTYMSNVATLGVASTDIFISQKPFASCTVGVNTAMWYAPIPRPELTDAEKDANLYYKWNETAYQADSGSPKTVGWETCTYADGPTPDGGS